MRSGESGKGGIVARGIHHLVGHSGLTRGPVGVQGSYPLCRSQNGRMSHKVATPSHRFRVGMLTLCGMSLLTTVACTAPLQAPPQTHEDAQAQDFPYPALQPAWVQQLAECSDPRQWPLLEELPAHDPRLRQLWIARSKYTPFRWALSEDGGALCARHTDEQPATRLPSQLSGATRGYETLAVQPVQDGWLMGLLQRYAGGWLRWVSKDGKTQQELVPEPALALFESPDGTLALTGFSHLGESSGALWRLKHTAEGWQATLLHRLARKPCAWAQARDGRLFIALGAEWVELDAQVGTLRVLAASEPLVCTGRMLFHSAADDSLWWDLGPALGALKLREHRVRYHLKSAALLDAYSPAWEKAVMAPLAP